MGERINGMRAGFSAVLRNSPHLYPCLITASRKVSAILNIRRDIRVAYALRFGNSTIASQQEVSVPSPLFNALFLIALLVPIAMYVAGVTILMASLVWRHLATAHKRPHSVEALAH